MVEHGIKLHRTEMGMGRLLSWFFTVKEKEKYRAQRVFWMN